MIDILLSNEFVLNSYCCYRIKAGYSKKLQLVYCSYFEPLQWNLKNENVTVQRLISSEVDYFIVAISSALNY